MAEVWLVGKLLYAWLVDQHARQQIGEEWSRVDRERRGTFWRVWKLIKDAVDVCLLGVEAWAGGALGRVSGGAHGTAPPPAPSNACPIK